MIPLGSGMMAGARKPVAQRALQAADSTQADTGRARVRLPRAVKMHVGVPYTFNTALPRLSWSSPKPLIELPWRPAGAARKPIVIQIAEKE